MNCKGCLHYGVCMNPNDTVNFCGLYQDKTEWVHLPCKVGDTVYCFAPCFDEERQPKLQVTKTRVVDIKTIATIPGMEFDIGKIGKTVFLAQTEAEKALAERRKH